MKRTNEIGHFVLALSSALLFTACGSASDKSWVLTAKHCTGVDTFALGPNGEYPYPVDYTVNWYPSETGGSVSVHDSGSARASARWGRNAGRGWRAPRAPV
jgi:hypothetical protein